MKQFLRLTNLVFVPTLLLMSLLSLYITSGTIKAAPVTDFSAGNIIDDGVFYNKYAMNVQQIQNFLNGLIPNCDTWGTGSSEYGGGTRAQYAASVGWPGPPYACLNNYHENPSTGETSFEKGGGAFAGGISAAQIIHNAAQQYGINPQVLLVMLKKESAGPLTADSWPLKSQYKYAMGYACPDSGPSYSANCESSKAGFYNQMMTAAWQLNYYREHPNDYRYALGINQIQYNPDPICGTKTVNIQNLATLSLYIYTPYTPNDAALSAYPGQASCGAYGNRNFYMFFKEWFGSTRTNSVFLQTSLATNQLGQNATMRAGDFIVSPNGKFVTTMQYDGNLVTYSGSKAIWHSGTFGNYGSYATFQNDGNLVIYTSNGSVLWHSATWATGANKVALEDDGRLRVYADAVEKFSTTNQASPYAVNKIGSQILSSSRLNAGDYLQSPDRRYTLVMQADGNLVVYSADTIALWNSRTQNNPGAYTTLQSDGNLVIYDKNNKALWHTYTHNQGASVLKLQNDGNLVAYRNSDNRYTWASMTQFNSFRVDNLIGTQAASTTTLNAGDYLRSSDHRYTLVMQADGNLVLYSANKSTALWNSRTQNNPGAYTTLQSDGNLVIYDKNNKALWNTYTYSHGASSLKLQSDGNLVIYRDSDNNYTWASRTADVF